MLAQLSPRRTVTVGSDALDLDESALRGAGLTDNTTIELYSDKHNPRFSKGPLRQYLAFRAELPQEVLDKPGSRIL
jgi:hypothetical protein